MRRTPPGEGHDLLSNLVGQPIDQATSQEGATPLLASCGRGRERTRGCHVSGSERHRAPEMQRLMCALAFATLLPGCGDSPAETERAVTGGPAAATEAGPVFLSHSEEQVAGMEALYEGPLLVRQGCVLIGPPGAYSVPIWPHGFTATGDGSGRLVVRDDRGGAVAVEGETFDMAGGYIAEFRPREKVEEPDEQLRRVERWLGFAIPEQCLGPEVYGIWSVGETHTLD
jgi:hypothetical protein